MRYIDRNYEEALDQILSARHPQSILLVTGDSSYENSPIRDYFSRLPETFAVTRYCGLGSNPNYGRLSQAVHELSGDEPDLIVAIGGGSVLDYAKLIRLYLARPEALRDSFTGVEGIMPSQPLLAIPTTAGSGSEATHFAVLYKDGAKHSIASPVLRPDHVIVDPVLSSQMPPYLTACSGTDALCQAVESLWSNKADAKSSEFAATALELIVPALQEAVKAPTMDSRRAMAIGAYYAGSAIDVSKTTAPHALSYYLTDRFDVPHGEAVAMTMEPFLDLNWDYIDSSLKALYLRCFNASSKEDLMGRFRALKRSIGLRIHPCELGVDTDETMGEFVGSVNLERLGNNACPTVTAEQMMHLISKHRPPECG